MRRPGGAPPVAQLVPEAKAVKNRLHLYLRCDDLETEVERVTGLGGMVLATYEDHVVLADPEGNEFCVLR